MKFEYNRDERDLGDRVALSHNGSSARLVSEDEIDPAELRRKQMECRGTESQYIQMFCERYRDRGIAGRIHADAAKQEKKEALGRAIAPGAYVKAEKLGGRENLDAYRSGVCDGQRYMTADDFARYYHDQRGYKFPQYRTQKVTDEERIAAVRAVAATREVRLEPPKKALWLTDLDKLPAPLRKLMSKPLGVKLNEWAAETFPRIPETTAEPATGKGRRPIPAGLVAAFVTVMVSMTMVISATVSVSQATREVSQLKESLSELHEVHSEMSDALDLKNDMLALEDKAVGELGMVHEKYLNGEYITDETEDRLEVFDEDRDGEKKKGLSALLSAFGFGD